ncbi:hypothetical protein D3Z45_00580 [Lachnospiraceae bacterium]|nr:hypothetical protein [Lachnospiraceae bacterium]
MDKKKIKSIKTKFSALIIAAMLAIPVEVHAQAITAQENSTAARKIHHIHVGSSEEGGACYKNEVMHIHEGDEEAGGDCFLTPVYHTHEGDETEGGVCYRTEVFHAHMGTEEKGGGCYGKEVYHRHGGDKNAGGGCYGKPVYHSHTGSSAGGGCYGMPVYHSHTGSSAGGGCYGTPVYHSHTGSAAARGGCYVTPVYHQHTGNEVSGGGCFSPVYHQHIDSCYEDKVCMAEYVKDLAVIDTWTEYCYHHGNTTHAYISGVFRHTGCDAGEKYEESGICWTCRILKMYHYYPDVVCGKTTETVEGYERTCGKGTDSIESWSLGCGKNESSIEKYELSCGKNEQTVESYRINCNKNGNSIDSYELNCNKTESSIEKYGLNCGKTGMDVDSYELSCEKGDKAIDGYGLSCYKTEDTVDSYGLSCGKNEEEGYAELFLTNKTPQWTDGKVVLQASYTDQGGFLILPETPFMWEGKGIANKNGEEVDVESNGIYKVRLNAENEDVSQEELSLSVEVKNIDKTAPVIVSADFLEKEGKMSNIIRVMAKDLQPDGKYGSGLAEEAYSFDGGKTWQRENEMEAVQNGEISVAVRDWCGNISVKAVKVSHIEEKEPGDGNEDGSGSGQNTDKEDNSEENTGNGGKDENGGDSENSSDSEVDEESGSGEEPGTEDTDGGTGEDAEQGGGSGSGSSSGSSGDSGQTHTEEGDGKKQEALEKDEQLTEENKKPLKGNSARKGGKEKERKETRRNRADEYEMVMPKKEETKTPNAAEDYQKETVEIEAKETMAGPQAGERTLLAKRAEMVEKVVKAVTFTVSSIMLAAGLLYLIYLMFRSIQVFDCDGEGNIKYAGSCIMKKTEEGFEVRIPDMIWEHSATGQYSLKPGKLFAKKNKGKELIVIMGDRKEAVWIDKEIPLRVLMSA